MQTPLPVELQGQIGQRLREVYNELVSEPVPDRFVELLQQLKMREGRPETGASGDDQSLEPSQGGDA